DFRKTDFSGRMLDSDRTLEGDLGELPHFLDKGFRDVYNLMKEYFDVGVGIEAIKTLQTKFLQLYPSLFSRRWAFLKAFFLHYMFLLVYYINKFGRMIFHNAGIAPTGQDEPHSRA
ncbi:MAG: hypothetical protein Q8K92_22810, partial [Leadbetterella sp.]|nr:hypothetical protein [Leadbetterella sp.]